MNQDFHRLMRNATALTRSGDLASATLAIQQAIAGSVAAPASTVPQGPLNTGVVLDGLTRIVPDAVVAPRTSERELLNAAKDALGTQARSVPSSATSSAMPEQWIKRSFSKQGRTISYRLFVPASGPSALAPNRPLIVMLHGCTQDADDFATGTQMNAQARAHGALVLYPEQNQQYNPQRCWNWFKPQHQQHGRGEPELLAALTRSIVVQYGADATRVYAAGLPAGGAMANILGHRYPDVFAAVGVHSGLSAGDASDMASALSVMRTGPVKKRQVRESSGSMPPTIVFHGDADATVNVRNGAAIVDAARFSAGAPGTTATTAAVAHNATRTVYTTRDGVSRVEYWQLHGVGHAWSGGSRRGSYTHPGGVEASAEMLRFFLQHRCAEPKVAT